MFVSTVRRGSASHSGMRCNAARWTIAVGRTAATALTMLPVSVMSTWNTRTRPGSEYTANCSSRAASRSTTATS